jgi:hypothetical protein
MDLDLVLRRAIESTCVIGRVPKNDSMQNRFERFKLKFLSVGRAEQSRR